MTLGGIYFYNFTGQDQLIPLAVAVGAVCRQLGERTDGL